MFFGFPLVGVFLWALIGGTIITLRGQKPGSGTDAFDGDAGIQARRAAKSQRTTDQILSRVQKDLETGHADKALDALMLTLAQAEALNLTPGNRRELERMYGVLRAGENGAYSVCHMHVSSAITQGDVPLLCTLLESDDFKKMPDVIREYTLQTALDQARAKNRGDICMILKSYM